MSGMHLYDRLNREILGARAARERPFALDRVKRARPQAPPRVVPGEKLKVRGCEIKYRRVGLEPGPNSPLLKRIVKYPYALEGLGRPFRRPMARGLSHREKRQPFPRPSALIGAFRGVRSSGGPLKGVSLKPEPLGRAPTVDEWLTSRTER
jgi:hypothetical protein